MPAPALADLAFAEVAKELAAFQLIAFVALETSNRLCSTRAREHCREATSNAAEKEKNERTYFDFDDIAMARALESRFNGLKGRNQPPPRRTFIRSPPPQQDVCNCLRGRRLTLKNSLSRGTSMNSTLLSSAVQGTNMRDCRNGRRSTQLTRAEAAALENKLTGIEGIAERLLPAKFGRELADVVAKVRLVSTR